MNNNNNMNNNTNVINQNNVRLENTTVCLPLAHGSIAFRLDQHLVDEFHTHVWTLYVRGPNNEDLSSCIQKVIFQLHPSFAQPIIEISNPPFEVTEKGWGEFEAQIRIVWKETDEQPLTLNHFIKLYPSSTPSDVPAGTSLSSTSIALPKDTDKDPNAPVISESYDEVVFTNPTESFFRRLQAVALAPLLESDQQAYYPTYSDADDFKTLLMAQKFLQDELQTAKTRYITAQAELQMVEKELVNAMALAKPPPPSLQSQQQSESTTTTTTTPAVTVSSTTSSSKRSANTANNNTNTTTGNKLSSSTTTTTNHGHNSSSSNRGGSGEKTKKNQAGSASSSSGGQSHPPTKKVKGSTSKTTTASTASTKDGGHYHTGTVATATAASSSSGMAGSSTTASFKQKQGGKT